jgi:formiminoglutamase
MEIADFFEPVSSALNGLAYSETAYGKIFKIYLGDEKFPDLDGADIAIFGVGEDRRSVNNQGCALAPDQIREQLYRLCQGSYKAKIADLGNIKRGHSPEDTYFALKSVVAELLSRNIIPVILGGSQDLTYPHYLGYADSNKTINIVSVDSRFDLGKAEDEISSHSFLNKIILHQPSFLFNYSNIGYQTYFAEQSSIDLMTKLYFDVYRLGQMRANIEEIEPIVRNADMLSFDISAIRKSDAPANGNSSPNGFYGEEACQIAKYAGMSDKLSSFGIYEINPALEVSNQTSQLAAQMIWYFIDGFYGRKKDFPEKDSPEYTKYRVPIKDQSHEIVFYKSQKSDRWWMDVPYPPNKRIKSERHHLVPCTYSDYQLACKEEMPDRWWQTFQKLS